MEVILFVLGLNTTGSYRVCFFVGAVLRSIFNAFLCGHASRFCDNTNLNKGVKNSKCWLKLQIEWKLEILSSVFLYDVSISKPMFGLGALYAVGNLAL